MVEGRLSSGSPPEGKREHSFWTFIARLIVGLRFTLIARTLLIPALVSLFGRGVIEETIVVEEAPSEPRV